METDVRRRNRKPADFCVQSGNFWSGVWWQDFSCRSNGGGGSQGHMHSFLVLALCQDLPCRYLFGRFTKGLGIPISLYLTDTAGNGVTRGFQYGKDIW